MIKSAAFIGIDPGRQGAIAIIDGDRLDAWMMPPARDRGIALNLLEEVLAPLVEIGEPIIGLEWNTSRPENTAEHAYVFGLQTGQIDGMITALYKTPIHIAPSVWKVKLGLPGKSWDKESQQGVEYFISHYPGHAHLIRGPRGGVQDGPLDALLIAHYLKLIHASPFGKFGGKRKPKFLGINPVKRQINPPPAPHDRSGPPAIDAPD